MPDIVNGNVVNETHANVKRSRSRFPLKQVVLDTHRFGEYHPHLVIDGVTSDKLPFRSAHDARSYTLKAPLMQNIQMHKDYFMVPLRAILPLNAEKIIANPTIGSDVPDDCYTCVSGFLAKVESIIAAFNTAVTTILSKEEKENSDYYKLAELAFKWFVFAESIFSQGSLLASLGCNLSPCFYIERGGSVNDRVTIDTAFDGFASSFISVFKTGFNVYIDGTSYYVYPSVSNPVFRYFSANYIDFRTFLMKIRDTSNWYIHSGITSGIIDIIDEFLTSKDEVADSYCIFIDNGLDLDLARLWAYHLSCAAFYTNDKVDYIYSAELFREYISSLFVDGRLADSATVPEIYFSYNSLHLPYDYLSSKYFDIFVFNLSSSIGNAYFLQYFLTLFGYHRSLRFKDYFTGSRTRPLAVGDTSIPVVGGNVSVIDVSRNIQVQRFLNAVNATGRKFEEYLKGIFGVAPSPDHHNPLFLAHTSDDVFAAEVENTAEAQQTQQNSVTAVFRGNSNKFAFEVDVNEPCIILGITSYDIERSYVGGIERSFFTKDRFDMFLPQLQYVGDQAVYVQELNSAFGTAFKEPFGYQFRDMDRKQLVNRAVGGFANGSLPGYAFVYNGENRLRTSVHISPDFIRSMQTELDQFYLSLTHYSLGTYFHFIVRNYNTCDASRPMAVNPQILG